MTKRKKRTKKQTAAASNGAAASVVSTGNPWESYEELEHLQGKQRHDMQARRRHRTVRYWCFHFQNQLDKAKRGLISESDIRDVEKLPGFVEFWLEQKPAYALDHQGGRVEVPKDKAMTVAELGGYAEFARRWDVDANLDVYIRHLSVWQEWNLKLMRIAPVIGDA